MTDSKETCEMLPCPLCGRQPDYQHFNVSQNTKGRIICTCGLGLTQGRNDTEDGTILKWNTRSDHAVQAANERKAEQAIAATVGNGTDLSKRLREVHGLHAFAELFGFDWSDESDWDWHDVACAMADAIDVTVGVGTCQNAVMCNVTDCEYNHKCRCTCDDLEIQDQECMTYRCRDIDYDEEEE